MGQIDLLCSIREGLKGLLSAEVIFLWPEWPEYLLAHLDLLRPWKTQFLWHYVHRALIARALQETHGHELEDTGLEP